MPHYKRMFDDAEYLYAFDLDGREITLEIEKCAAGQIEGQKGRKSKKPMLSFVGAKKKLALNKTNGKIIAALYGTDTDDWAGRSITIYPTTTDFGGETVECIRVRPHPPKDAPKRGKGKGLSEQVADKMAEQLAPPDDAASDEADEAGAGA